MYSKTASISLYKLKPYVNVLTVSNAFIDPLTRILSYWLRKLTLLQLIIDSNKINMIFYSSVRIINNLSIHCHTPISKMRQNLKILDAYKMSFLKYAIIVHNKMYSTHTSNISTLIKLYFSPSSLRFVKWVKLNLPKYNYRLLLGLGRSELLHQ